MRIALFALFSIASTLGVAQHDHVNAPNDSTRKSVPKEVHAQIGEAHMMIHYHAPAVRGRMIWGGLVPYNEVWVTGAHSATTWEFNRDIVIDGKAIAEGKYAIFTIPGKDRWTFILNKKWNQHLADDYDVKDDVIRVSVIPGFSTKVQERLSYVIEQKSNSEGKLMISWEKIKIEVPFKIK